MMQLARRFAALAPPDRWVILEAAALMTAAWAGLRLTPYLTLRAAFDRVVALTGTRRRVEGQEAIDAVRRAVAGVARRVPAMTCLVQALAADAMLRRRHLASELRFGVRRLAPDAAAGIEAHAWVECGAATIGAADRESEFEVLKP